MVTISKPISASQAQAYHREQFQNARENYYTEGDKIRGEWHGKLAAKWGASVTLAYDTWNRLTGKTYARGTNQPAEPTSDVSYTYDVHVTAGASSFPKGRLTEVAVTGGTIVRYDQYDALGRILKHSQITDSQTYPFQYSYNAAGGLESVQYPISNRTVFTCYDTAGRIQSVRKDSAAGSDVYAQVVPGPDPESLAPIDGYNAFGSIQRLSLDSGKLIQRQDDNERGQATMLAMYRTGPSPATMLMKVEPGYGAAGSNNGNVMTQNIKVNAGAFNVLQSYTYDALNRVQTVTEGTNWSQKFGYDRWGNRWIDETGTTGIEVPTGTPNGPSWYTAGNNRMTGVPYDPAGNGSPTFGKTYHYDVENRIVSVDGSTAALGETMVYDGEGRRVKRIAGGVATVYVYDAMGQLAQEYGGGASSTAGRSYLFADHLGSTRMQVAGDGTVQGWWDYAPFGQQAPGTAGNRSGVGGFAYGGATTSVMFTGQMRDRFGDGTASGLDYFGARYFSGPQGRFTSPDPLMASANVGDPQSWNRYTYAGNNPLRYNDPLGLFPSPAYNCSETQTNCLNDEQRRILENSKVKVGNQTLAGEKLWNAVGKNAKEREAIQNAFVNVTDRLASIQLAGGSTALAGVSSVMSLETDRIKANVSSGVFDTVSTSKGFQEVSGALHPGFDYKSFKSRDNEGNIQFSFGPPGANGRPGMADIDHDLYQDWRHAFEVIHNHATGGTTNQDSIRQLLLKRPEVGITPSTDPKFNRKP